MLTLENPIQSVVSPKTRDGRIFLKVKLKSLAAEARIIRKEESRVKCPTLRFSLKDHRTGVVRHESRHTQLAYAFLRGHAYRDIEPKCRYAPDWAKVEAMVKKYGKVHSSALPWQKWAAVDSVTFARFKAWVQEAVDSKKS